MPRVAIVMAHIAMRVSVNRDLIPLDEPGKPTESKKRCANGRNTNNDKFEKRNMEFHRTI